MLQIPIWAGVTLLSLGAVALLLGLRGRRIDREPRCPKRRCAYALGDVLAAREQRGEPAFPVICPECGREIAQRSALRIGTRRKMPAVLALAALLLAPGAAAVGFHAYAAYQSTKAVQTMPLWLLLRNAERDSAANRFVHQGELVRRASDGKIDSNTAPYVVDRILELQQDPNVEYLWLGDALAYLAQQGLMTQAQQNRAWNNLFMFELRAPDTVEAGQPLPLSVIAQMRAGSTTGGPVIWKHPWQNSHTIGMPREEPAYRVDALRIDGVPVILPDEHRSLHGLWHDDSAAWNQRTLGWRPQDGPWDVVRTPQRPPGAVISIEIDVSWDLTNSGNSGLLPDDQQDGKWVTAGQWLAHRGVPTSGASTLRTSTRIAPPATIKPRLVDRPEVNEWLRAQLSGSLIKLVQQPHGEYFVYLAPTHHNGSAGGLNVPADPPSVFGRAVIHHNGWSKPVRALADYAIMGPSSYGWFGGVLGNDLIGMYISANPRGWELELVPDPELTLLTAERPPAWAGDPIRVPIGVEFDLRCNLPRYEPFVVPPAAEAADQPVPAP